VRAVFEAYTRGVPFYEGTDPPLITVEVKYEATRGAPAVPMLFRLWPHGRVPKGCLGLSAVQRRTTNTSRRDACDVVLFEPETVAYCLGAVAVSWVHMAKRDVARLPSADLKYLADQLRLLYHGQFFQLDQELLFDYQGVNLIIKVQRILVADQAGICYRGAVSEDAPLCRRGMLIPDTKIIFEPRKQEEDVRLGGHTALQ
jgi:hypothetical protein